MREVLKKDVQSGLIQPHWNTKLAIQLRPEYQAMGSKFGARLAGMRKSVTTELENAKKRLLVWDDNNPIREQLKQDIIQDVIANDMEDEAAWRTRDEYQTMSLDKWKDRLKGMRKIVRAKLDAATDDAMALLADREEYPQTDINLMGKKEWRESEAEICLEFDIDNGLDKSMTPEALWNLREQYQEFELHVFRGHIYQAQHTQKWRNQWVDGKKEYALVPEPT